MARIQFGLLVTGVRGKLGALVFSSTGTTAYARTFSPPVVRRTPEQSDNRSALSEGGTDWATLSDAEKLGWNNWAADPGELDYDPWGNQRFLSGWQWFQRSRLRLIQCGLPFSVTPPSKPAPVGITGIVFHYYEPGAVPSSIAYDGGQFAADESLVIFAAMRKSSNLSENLAGQRAIALISNPGNTGEDLSAEVQAYFGDLYLGWQIVSWVQHQDAEGQRGTVQAFITDVEVQP